MGIKGENRRDETEEEEDENENQSKARERRGEKMERGGKIMMKRRSVRPDRRGEEGKFMRDADKSKRKRGDNVRRE